MEDLCTGMPGLAGREVKSGVKMPVMLAVHAELRDFIPGTKVLRDHNPLSIHAQSGANQKYAQ